MLKLTSALLNGLDSFNSDTLNFVVVPEKKKRVKKLPYEDMNDKSMTEIGTKFWMLGRIFTETQYVLTRVHNIFDKWDTKHVYQYRDSKKFRAFAEFFDCWRTKEYFTCYTDFVQSLHIRKNNVGYYWEMKLKNLVRTIKSPVYKTIEDIQSDLHHIMPYLYYSEWGIERIHQQIDTWIEFEKAELGCDQ